MIESEDLGEILSNPEAKIYFVGIGGIAMSAVAGLAKEANFDVQGSDSKEVYSPAKDVLDREGVPYHVGYDAAHIEKAGADLYVLSAGEDLQNPEVKYIYDHNLPHTGFPQLMYHLNKESLRVVVAGTHGKSTTAGLLGHLLKGADDASFMVGAVLQNYGNNFYSGHGHYFVFEGDEYKTEFDDPTPKFHYYKPDILVLTNLEYDHPDLFENFDQMQDEFRQLIANLPEDGLIVYNADDVNLARLVHESNVASASFGMHEGADFVAVETEFGAEYTKLKVANGFSKDKLSKTLGLFEEYQIQLPGKINVYNALACIATLRTLGFQPESFNLDLLSYKGVKRRFELVGRKNGITIVDDYAHHPTAVRETLEAARLRYFSSPIEDPGQSVGTKVEPSALAEGGDLHTLPATDYPLKAKLWAVFEPHTFSRTKATLPELSTAFATADQVLISEIYPAREKASDATITSQEVVNSVVQASGLPSGNIRLVHSKQEALDIIKKQAQSGDVIIVMAVGSFNRLAYELLEVL